MLNEQILNVFIIDIIASQLIAAAKLACHSQGIHHGCDAVETAGRRLIVLAGIIANSHNGLRNRQRFANAAGLNHNIVELAGAGDAGNLVDKVGFERAADAAVAQGHQAVVFLVHNAALLNQRRIDVYLANVVYNHSNFQTLVVGQNLIQQSCLTAT